MLQIKKSQLDFLDWELGVFFHFGIRTFYEGHLDWDMKDMPLDGFCPTELNCDKWIEDIKKAGAKYAILVCKHHDGFANWPSKYTEYSVKNTPWKNGQGDVVREFTDACHKHGIKTGLYYSPAQFHSVMADPEEYDNYFINQISELLTDYGKIDYLWFDGCGSEGHQYNKERIVTAIRSLQPDILIFNMWDPDTRWIGNEYGFVPMPNNYVVNAVDFSVNTTKKQDLDKTLFLPGECDCRIRFRNWFYSELDASTLKSVDELWGLYNYSVGRGANLLINIAPDRRGLLPDADIARFIEFGDKIKSLYASKLEATHTVQGNVHTLTLNEEHLINNVIIEEDLSNGGVIKKFSIKLYHVYHDDPLTVYESTTVGHKHICSFPAFFAKKVEITIEEESSPHKLNNIGAYYLK